MPSSVSVPVSIGELYDKISILEIKAERIHDKRKLENIESELLLLSDVARSLPQLESFLFELKLPELGYQLPELGGADR
jgi:hypothetical protein